jgi:hypothetical protein
MKSAEAAKGAPASVSESAPSDALVALESGALDPAMFPHREHIRLGYEMLGRYPFGEAVARFSRGLRLLAAKGGRPEVYHETITVAFLALIGERRAQREHDNWREFKATNSDLLDKRCLARWYEAEQLGSDLARQTFCLPRPRFAGTSLEIFPKDGRFTNRPFLDGGLEAGAPCASVQ